jgi:hypothetical protein
MVRRIIGQIKDMQTLKLTFFLWRRTVVLAFFEAFLSRNWAI